MAKDFSFDIVSDYNVSELTNAVDQAKREIAQRYDFKGTVADIEFSEGKSGLLLTGESKNQLDSLLDMLQSKMIRRAVSIKILDTSATPLTNGKEMRWTVTFKRGLDQEKAKKITRVIRDSYPKVKAQIQGESVRASATSKDDLQGVMALLKAQEYDFPLEFENYR